MVTLSPRVHWQLDQAGFRAFADVAFANAQTPDFPTWKLDARVRPGRKRPSSKFNEITGLATAQNE